MMRLALLTLAVHFLAPFFYIAFFEQYNGDDIVWHPRNIIVFVLAGGAMLGCPIVMTAVVYLARQRNTPRQTSQFFALWAVDVIYTFLFFLLQPAVY